MPLAEMPQNFSNPAKSIVHLTDFSPSAEMAFAHALRIALMNKARLTLMHVGEDASDDWDRFPSLRETLQRWGILSEGARRSDVRQLGIEIDKVLVEGRNVAGALAGYYRKHSIDMLVLAASQRSRWTEWLRPEAVGDVAQKLCIPTLFVPASGRGCVSLEDGHVSLNQVLVPVDHKPAPGDAVERGLRALNAFGNENSQLTLLYIGSESEFPHVPIPEGPWKVVRTVRSGNAGSEILATANELDADLIVMVTSGNEGILDVLRGSTTDQVLRNAGCPVLSIPEDD